MHGRSQRSVNWVIRELMRSGGAAARHGLGFQSCQERRRPHQLPPSLLSRSAIEGWLVAEGEKKWISSFLTCFLDEVGGFFCIFYFSQVTHPPWFQVGGRQWRKRVEKVQTYPSSSLIWILFSELELEFELDRVRTTYQSKSFRTLFQLPYYRRFKSQYSS